MKPSRIMLAWLHCEVREGRTRFDKEVEVTSEVPNEDGELETRTYQVLKEKVHPNGAVLVSAYRDPKGRGWFVRFPTTAAYEPFIVAKSQLKKARSGGPSATS